MKTKSMFGVLIVLLVSGTMMVPAFAWRNRGGQGTTSALSSEEIYWLKYMREEEKLARDVYLELYETWGMSIFQNIATSEQRHMDAVKNLLDKYGVPDPVAGNGRGVFTDTHIQEMYDDLILLGKTSRVEALNVGVIIEVTDIDDLDAGMKAATHSDIDRVFYNIQQGSYNHLAAFQSQLAMN